MRMLEKCNQIYSSIVVEYFHRECLAENTAIAFVYCDYKEGYTASQLLAILAKQLAASKVMLPQELEDLYEKHEKGNKELEF